MPEQIATRPHARRHAAKPVSRTGAHGLQLLYFAPVARRTFGDGRLVAPHPRSRRARAVRLTVSRRVNATNTGRVGNSSSDFSAVLSFCEKAQGDSDEAPDPGRLCC